MAYEDYLIQESTGEGGGWSLDRTEATADWFDHDEHDTLQEPTSFSEWLNQTGDSICE